MDVETSKWNESENGSLSLENIRLLYHPESHYRISLNKYPPATEFSGWSRKYRLFVLSGDCRISIDGNSLNLSSGDFADLPEGDYTFSVLNNSSVELVSVWEIPKEFQTAI